MRKALCMLGMFVIAMSSASLAADSMRVYTQSGSQMTSIALSSINKITYDDYMMYFDTGATHCRQYPSPVWIAGKKGGFYQR